MERFRLLLAELALPGDPRAIAAPTSSGWAARVSCCRTPGRCWKPWPARVPLALLTNGISTVQRGRIERSGIGGFFRAVVISEEVGLAKPDPRIFRLAADRLGLRRPRCSASGTAPLRTSAAARLAGMDTCWVHAPGEGYPPDEPPPLHRIADLRELPAIVG